ncbi:MAG: precorrin-6A reductase [Bacillota bacterium]|nr:precorrin-6A reductase [Bacillota bacterium]
MILVISGTKEAKDIISLCEANKLSALTMVITKYGKEMAKKEGLDCILVEHLTKENLTAVALENNITVVVDAGHPFSDNNSKLIEKFCTDNKIAYIRFERKETNLPDNKLIYWVDSMEEAIETATKLGNTIFLTTGSHQLETLVDCKLIKNKRLIIRVLPEHSIIKKCQDIGFSTKDIVAVHGPFSTRFNREMFKFYKTEVVVTKESGVASGTDTKVAAAVALGIPVVVVRRKAKKAINCVSTYEEVIKKLLSHSLL